MNGMPDKCNGLLCSGAALGYPFSQKDWDIHAENYRVCIACSSRMEDVHHLPGQNGSNRQ